MAEMVSRILDVLVIGAALVAGVAVGAGVVVALALVGIPQLVTAVALTVAFCGVRAVQAARA